MSNIAVIELFDESIIEFGDSVFDENPIAVIELNTTVINRDSGGGNRLTTQAYLSGAALSALRLVKLNSSDQLVYADSSTDATVFGLTFQAVSIGIAPITVISGLVADASWNWTRGAPLFLGTNGQISESIPVSGFIVPIGNAEAPTIININIFQGVQIS